LSTADGLTGYRIKKFEVITPIPGDGNSCELLAKVYTTDQDSSITGAVDFNEPDLMAVAYYATNPSTAYADSNKVIFDNEVFNQDIYITAVDNSGNTVETNYYLELEQIKLNINESTFSTLKNIRNTNQ